MASVSAHGFRWRWHLSGFVAHDPVQGVSVWSLAHRSRTHCQSDRDHFANSFQCPMVAISFEEDAGVDAVLRRPGARPDVLEMVTSSPWSCREAGRCASRGQVRKMDDEPHTQQRGWLKNGNPPGDVSTARRCGAKTRRATACQGPAMRNGRCRIHGGLSTGPRTPEGLERSRRALTSRARTAPEPAPLAGTQGAAPTTLTRVVSPGHNSELSAQKMSLDYPLCASQAAFSIVT
jgi:hypothetical protein